jgi:hypothetical protein
MRRAGRGAACLAAALLLAGCPRPSPALSPGRDPGAGPPHGYRGVAVLVAAGGAADTVRVAFAAPWRASDTGRSFGAQPAGGGWLVYGRAAGDTLAWGLTRRAGDTAEAVEFAGPAAADGSVRGCALPRRGGRWRGGGGGYGAFVLVPADAAAPGADQAPLAACAEAAAPR